MNAVILSEAEDELEAAFDYYEQRRQGLGKELVTEFRRSLELVLQFPKAWQPLDRKYRRCRLHRFPYGIVYRIEAKTDRIVIVAVMHLSRKPGAWQARDRS
jgi:toxin ParE2